MIKQGVQTGKCLVTKQCWIMLDRQVFPVWTGLIIPCIAVLRKVAIRLSSECIRVCDNVEDITGNGGLLLLD